MVKDNIFFGEDQGMNIIPVMSIESIHDLDAKELPSVLPILPLKNIVLFPDTVIPIPVRREKSIQLLNEAYKSNKLIGAITQKNSKVENPKSEDIFDMGTLGRIIKIIDIPNGPVTAIIQGVKRFELKSVDITEPYLMASVKYIEDILQDKDDVEMDSIAKGIKNSASQHHPNSINIFHKMPDLQ